MRPVIVFTLLALAVLPAAAAPGNSCGQGVLLELPAQAGLRTVVMSGSCGPAREVIITTGSGQGVSVNVIVRRSAQTRGPVRVLRVSDRPDFEGSAPARIIRIGD